MGTGRPLDQILESLHARKDDWVRVPIRHRVRYLDSAMAGLLKVAPAWVDEANRRRKIDTDSPTAGEEWISGPVVTLRNLRLLRRNLLTLARTGAPVQVRIRPGPEDRSIAAVLPASLVDRLLYLFYKAEIRTMPGCEPSRARIYREKSDDRFPSGRVTLVLGAGNISSIAPLDVIHKLMMEDQVVILKMNPVNEFLAPYLEQVFAELIRDGFLAVVTGDAGAGNYLCRHHRVDRIHLTGSQATYKAIVRDKQITAELGCVTPILVVPGRWSDADLSHQARNIAGMVTHNASFNCNAGKVLVLDHNWPQRDALLEQVQGALAASPQRYPYYPGAEKRYAKILQQYPSAIMLGDPHLIPIPWTFIPGVKPDPCEPILQEEPFCGVLSEVSLDSTGDAASFLGAAVPFVNESLYGDLSCMVLVDGKTAKAIRNELNEAIHRLRYGGIAVNAWAGMNFALGNTHWGAFPGNTRESIGSGAGSVHNCFLFDAPEKSVVYAPFRMWPKPVWFPDHRTLPALGRALAQYEGTGSPIALMKTVIAAMRA